MSTLSLPNTLTDDSIEPDNSPVLEGYSRSAAELIPKYESISSADLYAPVSHLLPKKPCELIDLGAGTGRDAAWFAAQGHHIVAVEPVMPLREAGEIKHRLSRIEWIDDSLPDLPIVLERGDKFDFVVLNAVWHHLNNNQRKKTMVTLRALAYPNTTLIMSLRNGLGSPERPYIDTQPEEAVELASEVGFKKVFSKSAQSIQVANQQAQVTWDWLVFSPDC